MRLNDENLQELKQEIMKEKRKTKYKKVILLFLEYLHCKYKDIELTNKYKNNKKNIFHAIASRGEIYIFIHDIGINFMSNTYFEEITNLQFNTGYNWEKSFLNLISFNNMEKDFLVFIEQLNKTIKKKDEKETQIKKNKIKEKIKMDKENETFEKISNFLKVII